MIPASAAHSGAPRPFAENPAASIELADRVEIADRPRFVSPCDHLGGFGPVVAQDNVRRDARAGHGEPSDRAVVIALAVVDHDHRDRFAAARGKVGRGAPQKFRKREHQLFVSHDVARRAGARAGRADRISAHRRPRLNRSPRRPLPSNQATGRHESSGFGVLIGSAGTPQFGWKVPAVEASRADMRLRETQSAGTRSARARRRRDISGNRSGPRGPHRRPHHLDCS